MINWQYFPKSDTLPSKLHDTVAVFHKHASQVDSTQKASAMMSSDEVLRLLTKGLQKIGYVVETGKNKAGKIAIPVLYGLNGKPEKSFLADAYHREGQVVLEIEAAAAVTNNRFLLDLFQACVMDEVRYCIIAVRNVNKTSNGQKDFDTVLRFMETIHASQKLKLPLAGVLIIGY
jgi:hypothetical protein